MKHSLNRGSEIPFVRVNSESLRKQWVSIYFELDGKLSKLKRKWADYERNAQSAYQHWYHSTFSQHLSSLTTIGEQIHELETVLSAVEAQRQINGLTKRAALEFVERAIQDRRDPFPSIEERERFKEKQRADEKLRFAKIFEDIQSPESQERLRDFAVDPDLLDRARVIVLQSFDRNYPNPPVDHYDFLRINDAIQTAIEELYAQMINAKLSQSGETFDDYDFELPFTIRFEQRGEDTEADSSEFIQEESISYDEGQGFEPIADDIVPDAKAIYRKIAKLLHPDRGLEMSVDEKNLWSEAQKAYQRQDAAALRVLLLRIENTGELNIHAIESISEIIDLARALSRDFQETTYYQRRAKKDRMYRFWASERNRRNREILRAEIHNELRGQLFHADFQLRELTENLKDLRRAISKRSKSQSF